MDGRTALVANDVQIGMFDDPDGQHLLEKLRGLVAHARGAGMAVEEGTRGSEPHALIAPLDVIVKERTPDSLHVTVLGEELGSRNTAGPVLARIQAEYCGDSSRPLAFGLGYDVTLASDAHGTRDDLSEIIDHRNEVPFGEPGKE